MSSTFSPHIVFAGGATHGHLAPGLNIANHVVECMPNAHVSFVGTGKPMERHVVRDVGYQYIAIPAFPPPNSPLEALRFVTDNVAGYCSARWLLRDQKASLVVGLGGLGSGAAIRAAAARGLPTVILEQNAVPGRATRWQARSAAVICTAFEQIKNQLPANSNVQVVGNAVRPALERCKSNPRNRLNAAANATRRLVVLGGNLGAKSLNHVVPSALSRIREQLRGWTIVHQSGPGFVEETRQRYIDASLSALVVGMIEDDAEVLAESDAVICRAGGTTLAELALVGAPAIVIPYSDSPDHHQLANARIFADAGACRVVNEEAAGDRLDADLAAQLGALLTDNASRGEMSQAMLQLAKPNAAADIAGFVTQLVQGRAVSAA